MMKKMRFICAFLVLCTLACMLAGCAREDEKKPYMTLDTVLNFADQARELDLRYFSQYEYVILGSAELPLYYFQLRELDYSLSIGVDSAGMIESMILSHISGEEIYIFHKNPGKLDPNATQYVEDASSHDIQKFIDKMTEN